MNMLPFKCCSLFESCCNERYAKPAGRSKSPLIDAHLELPFLTFAVCTGIHAVGKFSGGATGTYFGILFSRDTIIVVLYCRCVQITEHDDTR